MRALTRPSMLLRFLSDDPKLKFLAAWLSFLVALIAGATAIQLGMEAGYVVPVSAILMAGIFIALGARQAGKRIGFSGKGSASGRAAVPLSSRGKVLLAVRPEVEISEGRAHFQHLVEEIGATVKPYPPIDLHVSSDLLQSRALSKGTAARTMSYVFSALLAGVTVYGMVTKDREILFAVLRVLEYSAWALVAWSLGRVAVVRGRGGERGPG